MPLGLGCHSCEVIPFVFPGGPLYQAAQHVAHAPVVQLRSPSQLVLQASGQLKSEADMRASGLLTEPG
jgi:hypothetical protein